MRANTPSPAPGDETGDTDDEVIHLTEDFVELMRRRYRAAHNEEPPDNDALVRHFLINALMDPDVTALVSADGQLPAEERALIYAHVDRCVSEAIATGKEVDPRTEGPITTDAILAAARKINEN